jgi:hypothetical protein
MVRQLISMSLVCLLASAVANDQSASADESEAREVQANVESVIRALHSGDVDTLIRFSNPYLLRTMGGETAARSLMAGGDAQFKSIGITLEVIAFPSEPTFLKGDNIRFVIIPTRVVTRIKERAVEVVSYQVGMKKPADADWNYLDGYHLTIFKAEALLPGFPADQKLPEQSKKKL